MNGPERRAVLTRDFVSAGDTASQSEHRKKSSKDFKIDFDDDIDFDVHFRKTKVCARFIILCAFTNSLHSSSPFICAF